ncbi:hypothetical protein [Erythrobacter sp. NAP1]|uniref:hypothetical protein n=1 Tax=Erythrobacter sp. NAP1 TaxID=237727 RepID=UPI0002E1F77C|nr:hypothetical protein [Erythrobacter sp. NAP1]
MTSENTDGMALPDRFEIGSASKLNASGVAGTIFYVLFSVVLLTAVLAFYLLVYSPHQDLAGITLSAQLADALGDAFDEYSLYFPPAERGWYGLAVPLSELTGLRLDLSAILLAGLAVLFSTTLAYRIRRETAGATPLFLLVPAAVLVVLPVLYKNVFGLREHMVVLGLWPYLVLRLSDPDSSKIGWKTRLLVGAWLGATLTLKYLYAIVVLLVELADAVIQRRLVSLFRIENLVSGAIVALYLFFWLVIDPAEREAIGIMVSAIDANIDNPVRNWAKLAIHSALALALLALAYIYKLPLRITAIGLAMVAGAVIAAWMQSRWYSHHEFPITLAYIGWLWMAWNKLKRVWVLAISVFLVVPIAGEFHSTGYYQDSVSELEEAMDSSGLSVQDKRVGLLTMHPSPFNQYLASEGAMRWISLMNNAYAASELKVHDVKESNGALAPAISITSPERQMLHDEMLRLWEDMPPDALILDHSTSWPLDHIKVRWDRVFAEDERFQAILAQYRPALEHEGDLVKFTYLVRIESEGD